MSENQHQKGASSRKLCLSPLNPELTDEALVEIERSTVGTHENCSVVLNSELAQPLHCLLIQGSAGTVIRSFHEDTKLNGNPVRDAWVQAGDTISAGNVELRLECKTPGETLEMTENDSASQEPNTDNPTLSEPALTQSASQEAAFQGDPVDPNVPEFRTQDVLELIERLGNLENELEQLKESNSSLEQKAVSLEQKVTDQNDQVDQLQQENSSLLRKLDGEPEVQRSNDAEEPVESHETFGSSEPNGSTIPLSPVSDNPVLDQIETDNPFEAIELIDQARSAEIQHDAIPSTGWDDDVQQEFINELKEFEQLEESNTTDAAAGPEADDKELFDPRAAIAEAFPELEQLALRSDEVDTPSQEVSSIESESVEPENFTQSDTENPFETESPFELTSQVDSPATFDSPAHSDFESTLDTAPSPSDTTTPEVEQEPWTDPSESQIDYPAEEPVADSSESNEDSFEPENPAEQFFDNQPTLDLEPVEASETVEPEEVVSEEVESVLPSLESPVLPVEEEVVDTTDFYSAEEFDESAFQPENFTETQPAADLESVEDSEGIEPTIEPAEGVFEEAESVTPTQDEEFFSAEEPVVEGPVAEADDQNGVEEFDQPAFQAESFAETQPNESIDPTSTSETVESEESVSDEIEFNFELAESNMAGPFGDLNGEDNPFATESSQNVEGEQELEFTESNSPQEVDSEFLDAQAENFFEAVSAGQESNPYSQYLDEPESPSVEPVEDTPFQSESTDEEFSAASLLSQFEQAAGETFDQAESFEQDSSDAEADEANSLESTATPNDDYQIETAFSGFECHDQNNTSSFDESSMEPLQPLDEVSQDSMSSEDASYVDSKTNSDSESGSSGGAGEDSYIQEYMKKLLGNGEQEVEPAPVAEEPVEVEPETPSLLEKTFEAEIKERQELLKPSEFVPTSSAPEKNSNLQAMRELANQSARSAIETSSRKRKFEQQSMVVLVGAGICFFIGASLAMLSSNLLSFTAFGSAIFFSATGFGAWYYFDMKNNSENNADESAEAEQQVDDVQLTPLEDVETP